MRIHIQSKQGFIIKEHCPGRMVLHQFNSFYTLDNSYKIGIENKYNCKFSDFFNDNGRKAMSAQAEHNVINAV